MLNKETKYRLMLKNCFRWLNITTPTVMSKPPWHQVSAQFISLRFPRGQMIAGKIQKVVWCKWQQAQLQWTIQEYQNQTSAACTLYNLCLICYFQDNPIGLYQRKKLSSFKYHFLFHCVPKLREIYQPSVFRQANNTWYKPNICVAAWT